MRIDRIGIVFAFAALSLSAGCAGKLNPKFAPALDTALDATRADLEKCYEDALARDRETRGEMHLALLFDAQSKSPSAVDVVKSTIEDGKMQKCVARTTRAISLAEAPFVTVEKRQTISFQPEQN